MIRNAISRLRTAAKTILRIGLLLGVALFVYRAVRYWRAMTGSTDNEASADALLELLQNTDKPIVVDESCIDFPLELYGLDTDSDGYIVDSKGNRVDSVEGEPIQKDEIGFIDGPYDAPELVPDNISSLVSYHSEHDRDEWDDPRNEDDIAGWHQSDENSDETPT